MKRRRIIIALTLCLAGWFLWPRADARFVGTWSFQESGAPQPSNTIVFRRSGLADIREFGESETRAYMRWRVDGDQFTLGETDEPGRVMTVVAGLCERIGFPLVMTDGLRFTIVAIEPDAITLQRTGQGQTRLTRQ
ncbi:hypothetical protein Pan44_35310 [Caulifigura coniformis]|uniref:Lipocalin-like domain-containing protein n=1 Tax=Caulifigura coniformis TaxID=2527983 RepID=A0A517SHC1_9PLAN|nr:hypothetical protein [Caulifigura coniformis]QDT55487.1 hypothetical protein Pan44_35310 [Caulifigura coniformis]